MSAIASEYMHHTWCANQSLACLMGGAFCRKTKYPIVLLARLNSCCHKCHHIRWYHVSYRSQDRFHSPPIWLGPHNTVKNITSRIGPLRSTYQNLLLPAFLQIICCFLHQCNNHDGWIKMADRTTSIRHWHWWVNKHQGDQNDLSRLLMWSCLWAVLQPGTRGPPDILASLFSTRLWEDTQLPKSAICADDVKMLLCQPSLIQSLQVREHWTTTSNSSRRHRSPSACYHSHIPNKQDGWTWETLHSDWPDQQGEEEAEETQHEQESVKVWAFLKKRQEVTFYMV